jgi:hypothetical protein
MGRPLTCFLLQGRSFLFRYFLVRGDFNFDPDFFVIFDLFLLLVVAGKLFWIFLVLSIEHFVVVLKLFGEGIIDGILAVECVTVGDDEPYILVELFLILVLVSLDLPVDGFEVHWLFDYFVIIGNRLRYWIYWHAEGPGTFVHLQFQQKSCHDPLSPVSIFVDHDEILLWSHRHLFFRGWSFGSFKVMLLIAMLRFAFLDVFGSGEVKVIGE